MIFRKNFSIFTLALITSVYLSANAQTNFTSTDCINCETSIPTSTSGSTGGGNPGGMMIMMQQAALALEEPVATPTATATDANTGIVAEPRPTPISTPKPEPIPEPVLEALPMPAGDLAANAEGSTTPVSAKDIAVGLVAVSALGFGAFQLSAQNSSENKAKRKGKKCLHIQGIIEANLKELTSLEERIQDAAEDKIESTKIEIAKKILKLKKRSEKYSKLFEDCVIKTDDKKNIFVIHEEHLAPAKVFATNIIEKLGKKDFKVKVLNISNATNIGDIVGKPDDKTYFIGHSTGAKTLFDYLQTLPKDSKVGGAVFVASGSDLDIEKVKSVSENVIHTDSDDILDLIKKIEDFK